MKQKRTLYEWLSTNFLVHIRNEENFSLKRSFRINYAKILVFMFLAFVIISFLDIYFFKMIDGYYSDEMRKEKKYNRKLIMLSLSIDSLEREIAVKDSFIMSFKRVITGENELEEVEKIKAAHDVKVEKISHVDHLGEAELKLRDNFERAENVSVVKNVSTETKNLSDIYFFPPITGLVSNHYDTQSKHFGIDIIAKENEPIKCVADGSVIYSGWSYDTGYMLVIQHDEDLISIYKHNSSLLKKVGENVKSGEVMAIIGNSGELTTGPHLHFELWYKGNPLNPLDYIVFL